MLRNPLRAAPVSPVPGASSDSRATWRGGEKILRTYGADDDGGGKEGLHHRLAVKLAGCFAGVLLCTALVAAVGVRNEAHSSNDIRRLGVSNVAYTAADANSLLNDIQAHVFHYLISPNAKTLKKTRALAKSFDVKVHALEGSDIAGAQGAALGRDAAAYLTDVNRALRAVQGGKAAAVHAAFSRVATRKDAVVAIVLDITNAAQAQVVALQKRDAAAAHAAFVEILLLSLLALVAGVTLAGGLIRSVSRPLVALAVAAGGVADGDLSLEPLEVRGKDEIARLTRSFNAMVGSLREVISQVVSTSRQVAAASEQLTSGAQQTAGAVQQVAQAIMQVAEGAGVQSASSGEAARSVTELKAAIEEIARRAQEQARSIGDAVRTLNETSQATQLVASNAQDVSEATAQALGSAQGGGEAVKATVAGMDRVRATVLETAGKVQELGAHSQQIGAIIQVISDIADQTNLLALNAAIEAARAGEHGKGFAVVAEAVRDLAGRSSTATKEIAALIGSIQQGTEAVVAAMQAGTTEVERGSDLATQAGRALDEILTAMERTNAQVKSISASAQQIAATSSGTVRIMDDVASATEQGTAATQQMAGSSEQVNGAIQQVVSVSEQTAAVSEQVSASAQEMSASTEQISTSAQSLARMAQELRDLVARFRLRVAV